MTSPVSVFQAPGVPITNPQQALPGCRPQAGEVGHARSRDYMMRNVLLVNSSREYG